VELFDETKMPTSAFHFVLVLDESGSMNGTPWRSVREAVSQLLARRISDQGLGE
jgi:uncharacterized protein with von Willebrand factor type A (vWA) domain